MNQMTNMNQMQLIYQINILFEKNKSLEKKLIDLEKKFQDYQNKMESILFYNEIDPNSHTLDIMFNNLSSKKIIQNKKEMRLINKGIKHLFNRDIICFECKYHSKFEDFNPSQFKQIFNNINYSLIIIETKHGNKRFGAFYNNMDYNNQNNNQMNNQMMNPNALNPMMIQMATNQEEVDNIFVSNSSLNDYFIFSLDKMEIYYKEKNIVQNMVPNFSLIYNKRHESLLGNEFPINDDSYNMMNNQNLYKLTENQEFKVKYLELYEILI